MLLGLAGCTSDLNEKSWLGGVVLEVTHSGTVLDPEVAGQPNCYSYEKPL